MGLREAQLFLFWDQKSSSGPLLLGGVLAGKLVLALQASGVYWEAGHWVLGWATGILSSRVVGLAGELPLFRWRTLGTR